MLLPTVLEDVSLAAPAPYAGASDAPLTPTLFSVRDEIPVPTVVAPLLPALCCTAYSV